MKRNRVDDQRHKPRQRLGPAAAAMRRRYFYRDAREASAQISVNNLISDAVAMHSFHSPTNTRQTRVLIHNEEELALYRQKRRAEWEEKVKRGYQFLGNWVKYATWEAAQGDFARMRAVLERATQISIHVSNYVLWREYAELESSNGFVSHARNVFARGVALLPASVDLWVKYLALEMSALDYSHHNNIDNNNNKHNISKERVKTLLDQWRHIAAPPSCAFELSVLTEMQLAALDNNITSNVNSVVISSASTGTTLNAAQKGIADVVERCRQVMKSYVEKYNSVASWVFYYNVERHVFGQLPRAIKVIQTALEALPDVLLYGPSSRCTLPLLLIRSHLEANNIREARSVFQNTLHKLESMPNNNNHNNHNNNNTAEGINNEVEIILEAYTQFEQLYGDKDTYKEICNRAAEHLYRARLSTDRADFDTHLALYVLLRDELRELKCEKCQHDSDNDNNNEDVNNSSESHIRLKANTNKYLEHNNKMKCDELRQKMMECLREAVSVQTESNQKRAQRAVFVIELARQLEKAEKREDNTTDTTNTNTNNNNTYLTEARLVLANEIKTFPFAQVECPRLWHEAAALEQRHGNVAQARKLLHAAAHVTHDSSMFDTLIQIEEEQWHSGKDNNSNSNSVEKNDGLQFLRAAYQAAIKVFPQSERYWFGLAKLEERYGSVMKAHVLLNACIQTIHAAAVLIFSASSSSSSSSSSLLSSASSVLSATLSQRYELLSKVDLAWARRIALQRRVVRQIGNTVNDTTVVTTTITTLTTTTNNNDTIEETKSVARKELHQIYYDLLRQVWSDYLIEALKWKQTYENTLMQEEEQPIQKYSEHSVPEELRKPPESVIPSTLPEILSLALTRWSDAVDAIMTYIFNEGAKDKRTRRKKKESLTEEEQQRQQQLQELSAVRERERGLEFIRATFMELIRKERDVLHRTLAGNNSYTEIYNPLNVHTDNRFDSATAATTDSNKINFIRNSDVSSNNSSVLELLGHDAAARVQQWTELLLSPMLEQWAKIETTYGGQIHKVQEEVQHAHITQQTRRRTRLFRK